MLTALSEAMGWPMWGTGTLVGLLTTWVTLIVARKAVGSGGGASAAGDDSEDTSYDAAAFAAFQRNWMLVYCIIMLADWLQGTNMYTLYQSYGVDIGTLFLTGFSSAALFGTVVGSLSDTYGRRAGCVLFCVLEIVINTMEHSHDFRILLLGRVLGGISTSLLFTAFEAWMVTEHKRRGFPAHLLKSTFSLASMLNGVMAILAGVVAQVVADRFGEIGPFQVAIALTVLALVLVLQWTENYGSSSSSTTSSTGGGGGGGDGGGNLMADAARYIASDWRAAVVGVTQAMFEGGMYTFVFMWVPTLQPLIPGGERLPTGLVFASFMVCITLGATLAQAAQQAVSPERATVGVYAAATCAMLVPLATFLPSSTGSVGEDAFPRVLASFLLFELCVGAFHACGGSSRSRFFPENLMASVMNIFRVPLNALVITGTKIESSLPRHMAFGFCALLFALAAVMQAMLVASTDDEAAPKKNGLHVDATSPTKQRKTTTTTKTTAPPSPRRSPRLASKKKVQ